MPLPIAPCLWFDTEAEEAANFYASIFKDSKIEHIYRRTEAVPGPEGSVLFVEFKLNGRDFQAFNGGPEYKFTPAVSLSIVCADQEEVDYYWESLLAGGEPWQCGWLVDKYGVSWQVVPKFLIDALRDKDRARANKVMQALLEMVKLDVAKLQEAYAA